MGALAADKDVLLDENYSQIKMLENGILYAKWSGFLSIEQIKHGCGILTECIKTNGTQVHLSDHVNLKILSDECKAYLTQEWFPEVEKIGLKKIAALVSKNVFTRKSIDDVNEENNRVRMKNLTIENFNTYDESSDWLLS